MYADMVDKEQQINESNHMYGQLQDQLELMLDTIARETNDIKQLEQQLNEGKIIIFILDMIAREGIVVKSTTLCQLPAPELSRNIPV